MGRPIFLVLLIAWSFALVAQTLTSGIGSIYDIAESLGASLAAFVIGSVFVIINRRRKKEYSGAYVATFLVGGLLAFGAIYGHAKSNEATPDAESSEDVSQSDVRAVVSRQSADGVTDSQIDVAFADALGEWLAERTYVNAVKIAQEQGRTAEVVKPQPETVIVERGGRRFVVTRMRVGAYTPIASIFGIQGDEAVRVSCFGSDTSNVTISSGSCDDEVRRVFGTSISPF
jgi:hypothetical protein